MGRRDYSCLCQTCINDVCSPQCLEDSQCPAGYICDDCGWCVEDVGCNNNNTLCDGHDALCNIPSHDNCFWCNGDSCAIGKTSPHLATSRTLSVPGCAGDPNCPESHPVCGHGGGEHLCGCTDDEDCTIDNFICDTGDLDGDGDSKECIEDGCYENNDRCDGHDAVCNIPDHENCFYCDGMDCKPGKQKPMAFCISIFQVASRTRIVLRTAPFAVLTGTTAAAATRTLTVPPTYLSARRVVTARSVWRAVSTI